MISASELRIGNILNYRIEGDRFKPYAIVALDILNASKYINQFNFHYSPVVLTDQVLLDCGFDKLVIDRDISYQLPFKNYMFMFTKNDFLVFGIQGVANYEWAEGVVIKHLHTLQNLFYALNGEELEYKPKER